MSTPTAEDQDLMMLMVEKSLQNGVPIAEIVEALDAYRRIRRDQS